MSKNIKDYTPGVNDFLHFAEVMNLNAQMDMKKSPAMMAGGESPSPTASLPGQMPMGMAGRTPTMSGAAMGASVAQVATPSSVVGKDAYTKMGGKM